MGDKVKGIILKSVIIIGVLLELSLFPGTIIVAFMVDSQEVFNKIFYGILISFFVDGLLMCVLLIFWGHTLHKAVKAERREHPFDCYEEFVAFVEPSLSKNGYIKQCEIAIGGSVENRLALYIEQNAKREITCMCILRTSQLSNDVVEMFNIEITKKLKDYFKTGLITSTVNMIAVFCVNRTNSTLYKMVDGVLQQGIKNGRLLVGMSFGGKKLYISKQRGGFGFFRYKTLYDKFEQLMSEL